MSGPFAVSLRVAVVVALVAVVGAAVAAARARGRMPIRAAVRVLTAGSAAVVVAATALPHGWPPQWARGDLILAPGRGGLWAARVVLDEPGSVAASLLVANVILYVPLGLFATVASRRRGRVLLGCLALSVAVEAVQFAVLDRVASLDDVILNMAGAVAGVVLAAGAGRRPSG